MGDLTQSNGGIRLAIEGCGHGTLHAIYASVAEACKRKNWSGVDLLIICGDFQAVRNAYDLNCVSMPAKYREMGDFHEYYSGQRTAPYLTIFVGGNHEASNHLFELYYGGWVAPNIYYAGAANVLRLGPLRIAGLSGIWKGYSYRKPHFERLPYNQSQMKSIYDVRELDVRKLLQIRTQVDIGISHDWPNGIEWEGNWKQLFRFKPHLEEDARSGKLGSIAAKQVMEWLRPPYWFSAHLHCKYAAVVEHDEEDKPNKKQALDPAMSAPPKNSDAIDLDDDLDNDATIAASSMKNIDEIDLDGMSESEPAPLSEKANGTTQSNKDEIALDLDDDVDTTSKESQHTNGISKAADTSLDAARAALPDSFRRPVATEIPQHPTAISNTQTNFLALDKCLPGRRFLQLQEIPIDAGTELARPLQLQYDREWLSVVRSFAVDEPLALGDTDAQVPRARNHSEYVDAIDKHRVWVDENIAEPDLVVPQNFEITASVYDGGDWNDSTYHRVGEVPNPQTARFCEMLKIDNPFDISEDEIERRLNTGPEPDVHFEQRGRGNRGRGGSSRGGPHRGNFSRGGFSRGRGRHRGRGRGSFA